MTVYHGSNCEIPSPDVSFSKKRLDFGPAFYLTSYKRQAEKWALRKASRTRQTPIVNVYELSDDISSYRVRDFATTDGEWLDFVCACRRGRSPSRLYDIICGRVADDDVYKTIDSYLRGNMSREEAISKLKFVRPNNQIAINKTRVLRAILSFKFSYVVKERGK